MWSLARLIKAKNLNTRVHTLDDFLRHCDEEQILVREYPLRFCKGLYTVCESVPCIVLASGLSLVERTIVAWHELAHYWLHSPGVCFFRSFERRFEYEAQAIAAIALVPKSLLMKRSLHEVEEEYGYSREFLWFRKDVYERFRL